MKAFTDLRSSEGSFLQQQRLAMCFYMVEGEVEPDPYCKATNIYPPSQGPLPNNSKVSGSNQEVWRKRKHPSRHAHSSKYLFRPR